MGLNFRKSFGPKGFKVNVSKSGIGFSTGIKGARVSVNKRGVRGSVGAGGVRYTKSKSWNSLKNDKNKKNNYESECNEYVEELQKYERPQRKKWLEPFGLSNYPMTPEEIKRGKKLISAYLVFGIGFISLILGPLGFIAMFGAIFYAIKDALTIKRDTINWVLEEYNSKNN